MPYLDFFLGPAQLLQIPLSEGRHVFGRSDTCDVALPNDAVSRRHFILDCQRQRVLLTDVSANGTYLNDQLVPPQVPVDVAEGDRIGIPDSLLYALARLERSRSAGEPTRPDRFSTHEDLVEAEPGMVATRQAELCFVDGPLAGGRHVLDLPRLTLGGPQASIAVPGSVHPLAEISVFGGRAILRPGRVPVQLNGARLRHEVPIWPSDTLQIGDHVFTIRPVLVIDSPAEDADRFGRLRGGSPAYRRYFGSARRIAPHGVPVLVVGETGTGKELTAEGLHGASGRPGRFLALNSTAVNSELFESELFGHEAGAFTGAVGRKDGAFHYTRNGTLFLDEIGDLALPLQAKLLRVLQTGEVRRVGSNEVEYCDVRVIAATHRDLPAMVACGTFREDLLFRLQVTTLHTPPLRDCPEDIVLLAQMFLAELRPEAKLTGAAMRRLLDHRWPGNVRELQNVVRRAAILADSWVIDAHHIDIQDDAFRSARPVARLAPMSREVIEAALAEHHTIRPAANALGIPHTTLASRMKVLGIPSPNARKKEADGRPEVGVGEIRRSPSSPPPLGLVGRR